MDNLFIDRNAMFILLGARRYMKANPQPQGMELYCAARLEMDRIPLSRPWPYFYAKDNGTARFWAEDEYPQANHILHIDTRPGLHPRRAVKEVF